MYMKIDELLDNIKTAVNHLQDTNLKKVEDGVIKAYWVGHVIRVDIDTRELS